MLGSAMAIGALAAHLLVTTLPAFIAVRSVLGIADAFFFVAVLAAGSDLAPAERRGEAINLVSLSLYLGIAIGPPVGEAVAGVAGFSAVWALAAVVAAVAAVLSVLVPESAPSVLGPKARRRGRLFHPAAVFPGFLILTGAAGMSVFLAFLPLYATDLGMSGAGVPFAIYALLVVVLRIRFAKLPDTMGAARLSGAALALGAIGLAIFGLVPSPAGVIAGTIVFGLGVTFMFPALIALAVSRVDETERGSAVGTASAFFDVAFGLGPAVFGVLATSIGFGGTFLVSAVISAFGAALLLARGGSVEAPRAVRASGSG